MSESKNTKGPQGSLGPQSHDASDIQDPDETPLEERNFDNPTGSTPVPVPHFQVASEPTNARSLASTISLLLGVLLVVGLFVSWAFGLITVEKYSSGELYARVMDGRLEVRRMSAIEWARKLQQQVDAGHPAKNTDEDLRPSDAQALRLAELLRDSTAPNGLQDAPLLAAVSTLLGYSPSPAAHQGLIDYFSRTGGEGGPPEVQVYALSSLARQGLSDPAAVDILVSHLANQDPSVRKASAFALRQPLQGAALERRPAVEAALEKAMGDSVEDVRWNATLALAATGNSQGIERLETLLSEAKTSSVSALPIEKLALFQEAVKVAAQIKSERLRPLVQDLAEGAANLKLRQTAKELRY